MSKSLKFSLFFTSILSILLPSMASAVDFDARDTRVDLPVLSTPNNAVTPHMSADQNGHVYVVWSDNRGGSPSIYINTYFPDAGWLPRATRINTGFPKAQGVTTEDATSPKVCSDNAGHVYVVWVDDRAIKARTGRLDLYFRYSKDYGVTWNPEFTDERIDTDNPGVGDSITPQIDCDGNGNVYIAWEDSRSGTYEIYFRSLQIQFSMPVDYLLYYQYPEARINTGLDPGRFLAFDPVLSTDKSGNVYVAWVDYRNIPEDSIFNGIYFNVSKNHGGTWKSKATRIDDALLGFYQSLSPAISNDSSGHVYVAWLDTAGRVTRGDKYAGDGTFDVYFKSSSNYGDTWDKDDKRIDTTEGDRIQVKDVAIASNNKGVVSIVWASNLEATTKGVSTNYNIYSNHSENFGRSFIDSEPNNRMDTGVSPGITNAVTPVVQVDNLGDTFVAWLDKRSSTSNYDIYFNFSIEKGRKDTWQSMDKRLDYPTPPGNSIDLHMVIDNLGHVYVVWQDTKSALANDIYNIYFISGFLDIEKLLVAGQRLGKACFIATAAYGSPFERHVELLREFRDRYLMTNSPGRWFVAVYYRLSPPAAHYISEHGYLRSVVRVTLLPVVGIAIVSLYTTTLQKMLIFIIVLVISFSVFFIFKKKKLILFILR